MHAPAFSAALLSGALFLTALFSPGSSAQAGESKTALHISAFQGQVEARLTRYEGSKIIDPKMVGLEPAPDQGTRLLQRLGISQTDFRPVSCREECTTLDKGGTFILDLSRWAGHPYVRMELKVDGVTLWEAEGSTESFQQWIIKTQSPQVKTTDDRKLLVMLE